ncbi:uncharacterized protein BO97DRAFT_469511 [Aspergillus homomorphus CBS 101889]|uniref:GST N-terminal domain-containing protein n=1 Tax=Aspergillus homomorphus (strain CBS 101889) TaxID=1450537 RepID=A0A395I1Q2_ASPHC|nr:hypothetical protein BO97DRAFT_469511 [Aspergillus homomorphus CBS 101889]RAL13857.1 hypothetical protein BO97DRAFT_469511 [Aspergillus homomorphus CBS 101889]
MPTTTTTTTTTTSTTSTTTPTPHPSNSLTFYDIALRPPVEKNCASPNPWKARLALNFKNIPYKTTWVPQPDIPKLRRSLQVPAVRQFADGSDFFTLPLLHDPSTDSLVGDSFDIAVYLQKTYPDAGAGDLFPTQTLDYTFAQDPTLVVPLTQSRDSSPQFAEYARFNVNVDAAFTAHVQLTVQGFPFDPETEEAVKAEFVRRAGVSGWEDFALEGEARVKMLEAFRETLGGLGKLFARDPSGPFLLGARASHADFIVGGWLRMFRVMLPESEWVQVAGWHGGLFGRLYDALQVYAEVK